MSCLSDTSQEFINEEIINHIRKICFQIKDFLRTNHRFDDLIFVDIKSFVADIIKDKNSSITLKSTRKIRSSKSSNIIFWSQVWTIDRDEFKKAIANLEKIVNLFFSFSKDQFRKSFKDFINFVIESFVSSKLILSESFLSLTRTSTNIANQILSARKQSSSALTSISSDFENSTSARSFSKFDFTSRLYESANQKTDLAFTISIRASNSNVIRSKQILDFVENSKSSSIAQSVIRNTVEFAKSISILQFVLHKKKITLNSKFTSFESFNRSTTSNFDKQTIRITVEYEFSRITFTMNSASAFNSSSTNNMFQDYTNTQRRKLMTMMQKFWAQRSVASASQQTQSQTVELRSKRWIIANLEFFDFAYDDKIMTTLDSMQHVDKNTYFRNVHLFIDRVKDIVVIKNVEMMRNNLYICLRNIAMIWCTVELFEKIKKLVRTEINLDVWKQYLIKRFRDRSNVVMITIIKERYTMNDARRRRESREYASVIMRAARFAELESKSHQIMMIYNDLDLKFQRDILMSILITQIQNFLQHLDDKKNIWWDLASRNRDYNSTQIAKSWVNYSSKSNASYQSKFQSQFRIYYQSKFDQYDSQYSEKRNSEFFQRDQSSYSYDANQSYQFQSQTFSNCWYLYDDDTNQVSILMM